MHHHLSPYVGRALQDELGRVSTGHDQRHASELARQRKRRRRRRKEE